jgi:hypothetical protein
MRTIHFRALTISVLALFTFTGGVASAQNRSTAVLNALEVRQLVARAEPADHARLSAHFAALADRYTAEAKRHASMSQSFIANPSRNLGSGMSAHCKQLANLNTQAATTVRELATYHQKLASGAAATPPPAGAPFEGGAGAPAPTDQELNAMAAKAGTPADHRALEEYFLTLAKRYIAEAQEHAALATSWRGSTRVPTAATMAAHCDRLAMQLRELAKEANGAAAMHKNLAATPR